MISRYKETDHRSSVVDKEIRQRELKVEQG
jgi:hypothetical protein